MTKILTTFAALMVCVVTLVSWVGMGGNGPFAEQLKTIRENKDVTDVANAAATILLNYEKATSEEIVAAYHAIETLDNSKIDESRFTAFKTEAEKEKLQMNMLLCWERVKAVDPELYKKEDEMFKKAPNNDGSSLDDVIKMAKALKEMMESDN